MKIILVLILFIVSNAGMSEAIKSDNVKLHLLSSLNADTLEITDTWTEPAPFIYLGIELNIPNVKKIVIRDENLKKGECKHREGQRQLYFLTVDKPIKSTRLTFIVDHPCATGMRSKANLSIHVVTFDKKHYYNELTFKSIYGDRRNVTEILSP